MDPARLAAAFGLGAALGILPGPVQLLLLTESARGGMARGFRAMLGANGTFGVMLLVLAAGLSFLVPGPAFLRVVEVLGGAFLLWVAWDGLRSRNTAPEAIDLELGPPPVVRGILAVVLNPGAWVFMATTASALLAASALHGGRPEAFITALTMLVGVVVVDGSMVLIGHGTRRMGRRVIHVAAPAFALGLAAYGILLMIRGLRP